jgi:hypothetical protein
MDNVTQLKDQPGSLARGYRMTLDSLHGLLTELNKLEAKKKLPKSNQLTARLLAAMACMNLGMTHFPELREEIAKTL